LILGGLFGFLAAAGLAFLLEYLDVTIKSAADAERRLELPVLALIPLDRELPAMTSRRGSPVHAS
jgi:capsular polysaccharide biosynthesis protein